MSGQPLKITIDTNCVINLFDASTTTATSVDALRELIHYGLSGKVEIAATTRVEADVSQDKDDLRRNGMLHHLAVLPIVGTVARWDVSAWDSGDFLATEHMARMEEEVRAILFPGLTDSDKHYSNKINDVDHLVGHLHNRRDIFVTDDRGILRRKDGLRRGPGLLVMTPTQCLDYIDDREARSGHKVLPSVPLPKACHARGLNGTVSFDYSNNNHGFAIGDGNWLFETRWSKANNTAVYAYSDSQSIQALALAKGFDNISQIANVDALDFSSRDRRAAIGQIVVWRNSNGLFAATKILAIKDDTRGDDRDELTFEFAIQSDGSSDFSEFSEL